jgi:ubiquinone/menaquinone biosynthesis C-methylase UbiE
MALDINPDLPRYAARGVDVQVGRSDRMPEMRAQSIDLVFASNFFEHLTRDEITATIREVHRVLKPGGSFMVLQPNIRYCARDYWMFFDHITPIDDRAFVEALEINGFEISRVISRFLPFTTKSRLPKALFLIRLYLRLPLVWRFLGGQSLILSRRPK